VIITHHMALEDAARGYDIFEKAEEECRKVVLTPSGPPAPRQVRLLPSTGARLAALNEICSSSASQETPW
jgi:hypothetical protein